MQEQRPDQLRIEVNVVAWRRIAGRMEGLVFVGDKKVAEAVISCAVVDRNPTTGADSTAKDAKDAKENQTTA